MCPFSELKFVIASLDFSPTKQTPFVNKGGCLTWKNCFLIGDLISSQNFSFERTRAKKT